MASAAPFTSARDDFSRIVKSENYADYASLLPLKEGKFTQIHAGRLNLSAAALRVGSLVMGRNIFRPRSVCQLVPPDGYVVFLLPLRCREDYIFNGVLATPNTMFVSTGSKGYTSQAGAHDSVGIGIPRAQFIDTVAAHQGRPCEDVEIVDGAYELNESLAHSLRVKVLTAITPLVKQNCAELAVDLRYDIADTVHQAVAEAYCTTRAEVDSNHKSFEQALAVVQCASGLLRDATHQKVTTEQLCAAAGVGTTALNAAFHKICGTPPIKFLHLRRLMETRNELLEGDPQRMAVKVVAMKHGFDKSGRFAEAYHQHFGEFPSETLHRQPGLRRQI